MKRYIALLGLLFALSYAQAQKMNIGFVYPAGGQRGTSFVVEVGGQNLDRVTGATVSGAGVTAAIERTDSPVAKKRQKRGKKSIGEQDNLQIAQRVKVRITIAADAGLGMRDLRLVSSAGLSNRLFFEVGQLADALESEPNGNLASATVLGDLPCTINGQVMQRDRDFFSFAARRGEDIVIQTKARALTPYLADAVPGWFQSAITLYDERGREVAYCDDYMFNIDPVIVFRVPETGRYILQIHDALYRGREDFVYRIDIGQIPFVRSIFPLGGTPGATTKLQIDGVNLLSKSMNIKPKRGEQTPYMVSQGGANGLISNSMPFELSAATERVESAAHQTHTQAMSIAVGDVINARIASALEQDWYRLEVKANQVVTFLVMARRLGSPLDSKLTLFDQQGVVLAENDDTDDPSYGLITHHADAQLSYKFAYPGTFFLRLIDVQGKAGTNYAYRLHVLRPEPDFDLRIDPSAIMIPQAGTAAFTVSAIRKYKFNGPIEVKLVGLPKGYGVSYNILDKGESRLVMSVTAPEDVPQGKLNLEVKGVAHNARSGETVERTAAPVENMTQAFYYQHLVPTDEFRVDVTERQPFRLEIEAPKEPLRFVAGEPMSLNVRLMRDQGFDEQVVLMLRNSSPNVRMSSAVVIEPGQDRGVITLNCVRWRPSQRMTVIVAGVVKGTSKRLPGAARNAFTAAVTALSPGISVYAPSTRQVNVPNRK